jgi:hypothetical protein
MGRTHKKLVPQPLRTREVLLREKPKTAFREPGDWARSRERVLFLPGEDAFASFGNSGNSNRLPVLAVGREVKYKVIFT